MAFFNEREEDEEITYRRELEWFEGEFNQIIDSKTKLIEKDKELVKIFMNRLSETINTCNNKQLLKALIEALNKIEKKLSEM
ncbi:MAG: hypothetical protein KGD68_10630 [Candidatus Lokiarchaeota archaeon]|nr:hypothetical protein [Candidatus Lokiarchaeota archaeon]